MIPANKAHQPLFLGLLLIGLLHAIFAMFPPVNGDEALYWQHSMHLDWGYYTHPPMTGWLIAFVTHLFGISAVSLRLTAIVLHIGTLYFVYALCWEITQNLKVARHAFVLCALLPISILFGTAITTDCSLIFFYTASVYFLRKAIIEGHTLHWYTTGVSIAGMLLSKFMAFLFFPGAFFFLLFHRKYRPLLWSKHPYLAFALSIVLFSPFLYWNYQNHWLTFQFNFFIRDQEKTLSFVSPLLYIAGQLLAASPFIFIVLLIAVIHIVFRGTPLLNSAEENQPPLVDSLVFLAYLVGMPLLFFLLISIKAEVGAHWAAIIYPTGSVLLCMWVFLDRSNFVLRKTLSSFWYWASSLSIFLLIVPMLTILTNPKILPERFVYTPAVGEEAPPLSHFFGWEEIGHHLGKLHTEWSQKSEGFFFVAKDYSLASLLALYTPNHPDFYLMNYEEGGKHGKEFLMWERGNKPIGSNAIYVSDTNTGLENKMMPFFKRVEELEPLVIRDKKGILRVFFLIIGYHYLGGEPDRLSIW